MPAKPDRFYYVSMAAGSDRLSVNVPRACCYCGKHLDEISFFHLKGKHTTTAQINPNSMQVNTRSVELNIPYCPEHFIENQRNLERLSTINWLTAIVVLIVVIVSCSLIDVKSENPQSKVASILIFGTFLAVVITLSILPWLTENFLPKRVSTLGSLADMLKSKGEDFSQKALGISITPGAYFITFQLVNQDFAQMLSYLNNVTVTRSAPGI